MATPLVRVYEAFLARITADEWTVEEELAIVERDWQQLLDMAIFRFKYPRVSLNKIMLDPCDAHSAHIPPGMPPFAFEGDLSNDEIQLLAIYMKHEWVRRCINSWENIRQLYADKDFSQANHLDKLIKLDAAIADEAHHAEGIYDRSRNKLPAAKFKKLAGKKNVHKGPNL